MKLTTDTRNIPPGTEKVYQRTAEFGMQSFIAQYRKLTFLQILWLRIKIDLH